MKVLLLIGAGVLCAALVLLASPRGARASDGKSDDTAALRRAGALLWEMSEKHHEFRDRRLARGMTPDNVRALTESTARKLTKNRDGLAKLLPALVPETRFAQDLSRFSQKWPDQKAFLRDLQSERAGEASAVDITSLAMQVKDTRRGWKTLFPIFRP